MKIRSKKQFREHPRIKMAVPKKPPSGADAFGSAREGGDMSNRVRNQLKVLKESMSQNAQIVEQRLAKTGTSPRSALAASAAKYYPTLKKLADK